MGIRSVQSKDDCERVGAEIPASIDMLNPQCSHRLHLRNIAAAWVLTMLRSSGLPMSVCANIAASAAAAACLYR